MASGVFQALGLDDRQTELSLPAASPAALSARGLSRPGGRAVSPRQRSRKTLPGSLKAGRANSGEPMNTMRGMVMGCILA